MMTGFRSALLVTAISLCSMAAHGQTATTTAPEDETSVIGEVQAQIDLPEQPAPGGILVLNQERLLSESRYGQRIQLELEAASQALATENREIEALLTEEELRLTDLRPTLDPAEFRPIAEEFDMRVEAIRAAQDAKARALQAQVEAARTGFFELAFPILLDIVQSRGAAILMDSRSVLLSAETVDITDAAIQRVNAEIGRGGDAPLLELDGTPLPPVPRPETAP